MKFISHLGKFEDLESNDSSYEFQSKMNDNDSANSFIEPLPGPNDAFDPPADEGGDDMPF